MTTAWDRYYWHAYARSPEPISNTTASTAATYQATGTAVDKLHEFSAAVDCYVKGGTSATVTITGSAGQYVKAGAIYLFRPVSGRESLGFKTVDGSSFSSTIPATISIREP